MALACKSLLLQVSILKHADAPGLLSSRAGSRHCLVLSDCGSEHALSFTQLGRAKKGEVVVLDDSYGGPPALKICLWDSKSPRPSGHCWLWL